MSDAIAGAGIIRFRQICVPFFHTEWFMSAEPEKAKDFPRKP